MLVVEGFADWEPAHAVAELRRHGHNRVESVGLPSTAVRSMGGITVLPSRTVSEVNTSDVALFILPGGDRWENAPVESDLEQLLNQLDACNVPIAAICGATVAISRIGLLRRRRHTSNGLEYLRSHVPGYTDAGKFSQIQTNMSSGLGDVEFARELFEELEAMSTKRPAEAWHTTEEKVAILRRHRLRLAETPVFHQVQAGHEVAKIPLLEILTKHRRTFLVAVGLKVSEIA